MKVLTLFTAAALHLAFFIQLDNISAQSFETKLALNEAKTEALKAEIDRLQNDISVLRWKVDNNEDGLKDSEIKFQVSKQMLDVAEKNLAAPTLIFIAIGAIISLIGFGVYKITKKTFQDKIEEQVKALDEQRKALDEQRYNFEKKFDTFQRGFDRTIEIFEKQNKEDLKQIHRIVADYLSKKGLDLWQSDIITAISYGERALKQAKLAEMDKSDDLNQIGYYSFYLSNLGYYFAIEQKQRTRSKAISLTQEGLDIGIENQALNYERKLNLVDNYLFAVTKCDDNCECRRFWIELYDEYSEDLCKHKIWDIAEKNLFSEYYERIKKM